MYWRDPSGLFETWGDAYAYKRANKLGGSRIEYDFETNLFKIIDGDVTIVQIGQAINKSYVIGEDIMVEQSRGGGGSENSTANSNSKDNGFGINFTTTTGGAEGPVKPRNGGRYTFTILADIIMLYVDIFGPKTKVGVDRDAINALNNQKNEGTQIYEYKTWTTLPTDTQPDRENYFRLIETNRRVEMTPTENKNTNWDERRMIDSIKAVEIIKAHEKSKIEFEKNLNK